MPSRPVCCILCVVLVFYVTCRFTGHPVCTEPVTSRTLTHDLLILHHTEMGTSAVVDRTLLGHLWEKAGKQDEYILHRLTTKLQLQIQLLTPTDLAVLATEVWFAITNVRLDPILTFTSILAGGWLALVTVYTQVHNMNTQFQ